MSANEHPTVSILMTAYNREQFIGESIESILSSTFDDFELVIVDDQSMDRTLEIARSYESDPRVKVYRNEVNLGDFANRNRAAELAKGKYLKYLDSDDLMYPHCLQVMVANMEEFPEAGFGASKPAELERPAPYLLTPRDLFQRHFHGKSYLGNAPSSMIFRTDRFRKIGGFNVGQRFNDTEFNMRMAAHFPMIVMPPGLMWWRAHGTQELTYLRDDPDFLSAYFRCQLEMLEADYCPLEGAERVRAIRWLKS